MSRSSAAILVLAIALAASNAWWLYVAFDAAVTCTHLDAALEEHKQALDQTLALLPVVARPGISRAEVITAARHPELNTVPFEKDGFVWVDRIGLKFSGDGQVIEASRAWSPP